MPGEVFGAGEVGIMARQRGATQGVALSSFRSVSLLSPTSFIFVRSPPAKSDHPSIQTYMSSLFHDDLLTAIARAPVYLLVSQGY